MSATTYIIIPCYNEAVAVLRQTLNELLEENLPRLEAAGIKASIVQQKRVPGEAGIPAAWNQALALAQGDIVALLNSDDWYEPDCLQKVHEGFAANPDIEALVCPIRLHLPHGGQKLLAPRCLCLLPLLMPWPHPGSFFKASLYRRLGQYDTRYSIAADYDFVWRCHRAGVPWLALGDILVNMEGGGMANRNPAARTPRETHTFLTGIRRSATRCGSTRMLHGQRAGAAFPNLDLEEWGCPSFHRASARARYRVSLPTSAGCTDRRHP